MKPFVLITGMHRSGTSFLVRALNLCGLYLGELDQLISTEWDFRADNLRGHWEHKKILELGEKTLSQNKGTWDSIPEKITINDEIGNQIKEYTDELMITPSLATGFKDPRIIINYESWSKYLPGNVIVVGIFRDPLKVAESLKIRNGFSYEKSLNLWLQYNTKLLEIVKDGGFLLNFDWPVNKLLSEVDCIVKKLGLVKNANLSDWYSSKLLKSDKSFDSKYNIPKEIQILYTQLKEKSEKNQLIDVKTNNDKPLDKILANSISQNYLFGSYFRKINNSNLEKIKKYEDNLSELKIQNQEIKEELLELKNRLNEFSKQPLWKLIQIYLGREDLRNQFPEVRNGEYEQLINWASKVISKEIDDNSFTSLKIITDWISKEMENQNESKESKITIKEYETKMQASLENREIRVGRS